MNPTREAAELSIDRFLFFPTMCQMGYLRFDSKESSDANRSNAADGRCRDDHKLVWSDLVNPSTHMTVGWPKLTNCFNRFA